MPKYTEAAASAVPKLVAVARKTFMTPDESKGLSQPATASTCHV
jgi:hypothetical protein